MFLNIKEIILLLAPNSGTLLIYIYIYTNMYTNFTNSYF